MLTELRFHQQSIKPNYSIMKVNNFGYMLENWAAGKWGKHVRVSKMTKRQNQGLIETER